MVRDTTTGGNFENIVKVCIDRSCQKNGLEAFEQRTVGGKPGGGKHRVDYELVAIGNENIRGLVSCKKQGTSGTAQERSLTKSSSCCTQWSKTSVIAMHGLCWAETVGAPTSNSFYALKSKNGYLSFRRGD